MKNRRMLLAALLAVMMLAAVPAWGETDGEEIPVDNLTTYSSIGENMGWQDVVYTLGEANTGKQYVTFLVTPLLDKVDGSVCFTDYTKFVTGFSDLAIMVRMNGEGFFDVRNGDAFEKLADVPFVADGEYAVEIIADMDAKTYTVYVTADEQRTMIAENYAFRTTANDAANLGKVFFISASDSEQFNVDALKRLTVYDAAKSYLSTGENLGWQQKMIKLDQEYTGKIRIEYDMTPLIPSVDGSVDFTDGAFDVYGFADLAMLVRMHITEALFDARNGDAFERLADIPVTQDTKYHIEIEADIDGKLYSVYVTPEGGERTQLAKDFNFRTTAAHADSIGQCVVISAHESDSIRMENLVITPQ